MSLLTDASDFVAAGDLDLFFSQDVFVVAALAVAAVVFLSSYFGMLAQAATVAPRTTLVANFVGMAAFVYVCITLGFQTEDEAAGAARNMFFRWAMFLAAVMLLIAILLFLLPARAPSGWSPHAAWVLHGLGWLLVMGVLGAQGAILYIMTAGLEFIYDVQTLDLFGIMFCYGLVAAFAVAVFAHNLAFPVKFVTKMRGALPFLRKHSYLFVYTALLTILTLGALAVAITFVVIDMANIDDAGSRPFVVSLVFFVYSVVLITASSCLACHRGYAHSDTRKYDPDAPEAVVVVENGGHEMRPLSSSTLDDTMAWDDAADGGRTPTENGGPPAAPPAPAAAATTTATTAAAATAGVAVVAMSASERRKQQKEERKAEKAEQRRLKAEAKLAKRSSRAGLVIPPPPPPDSAGPASTTTDLAPAPAPAGPGAAPPPPPPGPAPSGKDLLHMHVAGGHVEFEGASPAAVAVQPAFANHAPPKNDTYMEVAHVPARTAPPPSAPPAISVLHDATLPPPPPAPAPTAAALLHMHVAANGGPQQQEQPDADEDAPRGARVERGLGSVRSRGSNEGGTKPQDVAAVLAAMKRKGHRRTSSGVSVGSHHKGPSIGTLALAVSKFLSKKSDYVDSDEEFGPNDDWDFYDDDPVSWKRQSSDGLALSQSAVSGGFPTDGMPMVVTVAMVVGADSITKEDAEDALGSQPDGWEDKIAGEFASRFNLDPDSVHISIQPSRDGGYVVTISYSGPSDINIAQKQYETFLDSAVFDNWHAVDNLNVSGFTRV